MTLLSCCSFLMVVTLTISSTPAQITGFRLAREPIGRVEDDSGKPLHGAKIWIRIERVGPRLASNQILSRQPLPTVFSSRDGSFALPLTKAQRSLTQWDGRFSLVVEKSGFRTWIEPLTAGLRGYLGSMVRLRRFQPEDQVEIRVLKPVKGMLVLLRRRAAFGVGEPPHVNLTKVIRVPENGVVKVHMALVPTPRVIANGYSYVPLSREAQVLYPGRSTKPIAVGLRTKIVRFPANHMDASGDPRLVAGDGKPLKNPRGLYCCPDGEQRWFALTEGRLARDRVLYPRAVTADGCVVQFRVEPRSDEVQVERAPVLAGKRRLRVLGADRIPLVGASVSWQNLAAFDVYNPRHSIRHPRRMRRSNAGGIVDIPDIVDREHLVLILEAPGYNRRVVQQPRTIGVLQDVTMPQAQVGTVEIELVDRSGVPVVGAFLRFDNTSHDAGGLLGRIPRTNSRGVIRLNHIPRGTHNVYVVADGLVDKNLRVKVEAGKISRVRETIDKATVVRGLTVSEDVAVPFVPIRPAIRHGLKQIRTASTLMSDSLGRFVLHAVPRHARQVSVRPMEKMFRGVNHAVDLDGKIVKVPVSKPSWLLVTTPKGNQLRCVHDYVMNNRRQSNHIRNRGIDVAGTLCRLSPEDSVSLFFQLQSGPPIRVDTGTIAVAKPKLLGGEGKGGVRLVEEPPIRRRVPIRLVGADDIKDGRFRLEISKVGGGTNTSVYEDLGLGVSKGQDGKWYFVARDDNAYSGILLHPNFKPVRLDIPEKPKNGEEGPVKVELQPATPLGFALKLSRRVLRPTSRLRVRIRRNQNPKTYVLRWEERIADAPRFTVDADRVLRFKAPLGLSPGKYRIDLRIYGTRVSLKQDIEVSSGGQCEVQQLNVKRKR